MYNISKTVLKKEESEDPQYNALKLVEVIIVNHRLVTLSGRSFIVNNHL